MARGFKLFLLAVAQFIKFILILAAVGALAYGAYFAWVKFIKNTQQHTGSAKSNYAEKVEVKP
ncbi:MAG: hypothetical protein WC071_11505 [Victivallaceae bacterium]